MVSRKTLRTVGWAALIVGAAMVLAGLGMGGGRYVAHGLTITEILVRAALMGVGALLAAAGRKALARQRLMGATSLDATLAADPRPPVLYLRSFEDDEDAGRYAELPAGIVGGASGAVGGGAGLSSLGALHTEEEQIGHAFATIGPFVAVQQPGKENEQLGAARSGFTDEQWRGEVEDLIRKSARVVLRAGFGEGLRWEIEKTVELADPARVILLAPFGMAKYQAFMRFASPLFPRGLPEQTVPWIPVPNFSGVVLFDTQWSPRYVPLRMPVGPYAVVERALKRAIERGKPGRRMSGVLKRELAKGRLSSIYASTTKEFSFHLDEGARDMHLRLLVDSTDPAMGAGREQLELYLDGARIGARLDTVQLRDGYELALPDARQLRIQRSGKHIKVWLDGKPVAPS